LPLAPLALTLAAAAICTVAPAVAPALLVTAAVFPVADVAVSPDVIVLGGLLLSLPLQVFLGRRWPDRRITVSRAWLPFVAFALVLLCSALVNYGAPGSSTLVSDTKWFIFRMSAVGAVVLYAKQRHAPSMEWHVPLILAGCALALLRVLQVAGWDLTARLSEGLGVLILSDVRVEGWHNTYGSYLTLVLPLVMVPAVATQKRLQAAIAWSAAMLLAVGFLEVQSRTATLIVALQLLFLATVTRSMQGRVRIAAVGLAVLGVTVFDPAFVRKSALLTVPRPNAEFAVDRTGVVLEGSPRPEKPLAWRAPLVTLDHRLRQIIRVHSPSGDRLHIFVRRAGGGPNVRLAVWLDGHRVGTITDLPETHPRWVSVLLDRKFLRRSTVEVELGAEGSLNARRNYVEVGGLSVSSNDYRSEYRNKNWTWTNDLSWDPGRQFGTFLILLGRRSIEHANVLRSSEDAVLDQSTSDRLLLWHAAVKVLLAHPWFGTGYYTFGHQSDAVMKGQPRFFEYANAHSAFFQVASDLGFSGLVAFTWIFLAGAVILLREGLGARRTDPAVLALTLAFASVLFTSGTQTWFVDVRYCVPAWIVFGTVWLHDFQRDASALPRDKGLPLAVRSH